MSRGTISNYLDVLEATHVVHVIRPFSTHRPTEIASAPKVYGFETGFMCFYWGWYKLRWDGYGPLWEHFVLNKLHAHAQSRKIFYWRDKRGHEIDFVFAERQWDPIARECQFSASEFDGVGLAAFRRQYLKGDNFVVAKDITKPFKRSYDDLNEIFVGAHDLLQKFL